MIKEILGFGDDLIARFSDTVDSVSVKVLVYVVAWFQGVFGINTTSDIISSRAVFFAYYSEEKCCYLFIMRGLLWISPPSCLKIKRLP